MPLCKRCDASVRADYRSSEYFPMCVACIAVLKRGADEGHVVSNEDRRGPKVECAVCRRVCCYMRVGDGQPMCWECHGWWKRCARDDEYVAASVRLFERLDGMGMGHFMSDVARRLLTRKERKATDPSRLEPETHRGANAAAAVRQAPATSPSHGGQAPPPPPRAYPGL